MWNIGMPELVIILVIALIIFGPRKLPELGRSLGKSIGEFKKASNELRHTLDEEIRMEDQKDQRAKTEAEQRSALEAANSMRDAITTEPAQALREKIEKAFEIEMGRFHERPVGPHPRFSYQVAFKNDQLAPLLSWLALNRGDLTIFVHPNTGQDLEDHRDRAIWLGQQVPLVLDIFTKRKDS